MGYYARGVKGGPIRIYKGKWPDKGELVAIVEEDKFILDEQYNFTK